MVTARDRARDLPPSDKDPGQPRVDLVEDLFEHHNQALQRFLARRLDSRDDVSEVAQEVYLRLMRLKDDAKLTAHPRAYLFAVANSAIRDRRRRQRVRKYGQHQSFDDEATTCPEPSPETVLYWKQRLKMVRSALDELSPRCRRIFVLHRFKHRTYRQIGDEMGISSRTVENYISEALQLCRSKLGTES